MQTRLLPVVVAALAAAMVVSGCTVPDDLDGSDDDDTINQPPSAELTADKRSAFVGDEFEFDASGSSDPDGNITRYEFDFGDGNRTTVRPQDQEDPKATYRYSRAGEYEVSVLVTDDGADGAARDTDSAVVDVAVNDRHQVEALVVEGGPLNGTGAETAEESFPANDGADRFEANLTIDSALVSGASEITINVTAPDGSVIVEETVTVGPNESEDVMISGQTTQTGDHAIVITAESGSATVAGELVVYYDDGM